jgi:hypothetical protein
MPSLNLITGATPFAQRAQHLGLPARQTERPPQGLGALERVEVPRSARTVWSSLSARPRSKIWGGDRRSGGAEEEQKLSSMSSVQERTESLPRDDTFSSSRIRALSSVTLELFVPSVSASSPSSAPRLPSSEAPLDVIASFAGPALFGRLAFACRSAFDALEGAEALRRSLEMAGWTSEVIESLGGGWLGKMEMLEELWAVVPAFASFDEEALLRRSAEDFPDCSLSVWDKIAKGREPRTTRLLMALHSAVRRLGEPEDA